MENKEPKETVVLHFNISRQLWEKFKALTPSNKTLERAVIELIERKVKNDGNQTPSSDSQYNSKGGKT